MNKNIYRQYDSRWATKAYPDKASSFGGNGCGACSVLHCIIEMVKYANYTPAKIISYMKQFAVSGQGTTWNGIPTALKHYGMTNVKELNTMPELWAEMKKGNRVCIILFTSGKAPNGTVWTTGGHYVAGVKYKEEKDLHYLYMKDSGQRKHDKWYCYEKSMKGLCYKVWVATIPKAQRASAEPKAQKVSTVEPTETLEQKVARIAKELAWAKGTDKDKYSYKSGSATKAFTNALHKVYPSYKNWSKAPSKGASCDVFVGTVLRTAGITKYPRGLDQQLEFTSKKFKTHKKKDVTPYSMIKSLGVHGTYAVQYRKDGNSKHTLIYSDGIIYEAGHEKTYGHVNTSLKKIKTKRPLVRVVELR